MRRVTVTAALDDEERSRAEARVVVAMRKLQALPELPLQPLRVQARFGGPSGQPTDRLRGRAYAQNHTPQKMLTGIAATRTAPQRERRSRTAVGATAGRSHRTGTNRSAGHRRRAQTTIKPASRLSSAALSPPCIARGYVRAASAANAADRRPPRSFPRATSLLPRTIRACAARSFARRSPWLAVSCMSSDVQWSTRGIKARAGTCT